MTRNNNNTSRFAALLAALAVVASITSGTALAASASGVTVGTVTDESTTDGTVQIAFNVSVDAGTTANITQLAYNGTTATVSQYDSMSNDTVTLHTADYSLGTLESSGTVNVTYTVNGTSYTESVSYDVDADDDGTLDTNDEYPNNAPTTYSVNKSDNETVASAYVQAKNGSLDLTVYGIDDSGNRTQVGTGTFTVGSTTELAEVTVSNGTYSQYDIEIHTNATVTDHGLIYESNSGGGGSSGGSSASPATIGAVIVVISGAALLLLRE